MAIIPGPTVVPRDNDWGRALQSLGETLSGLAAQRQARDRTEATLLAQFDQMDPEAVPGFIQRLGPEGLRKLGLTPDTADALAQRFAAPAPQAPLTTPDGMTTQPQPPPQMYRPRTGAEKRKIESEQLALRSGRAEARTKEVAADVAEETKGDVLRTSKAGADSAESKAVSDRIRVAAETGDGLRSFAVPQADGTLRPVTRNEYDAIVADPLNTDFEWQPLSGVERQIIDSADALFGGDIVAARNFAYDMTVKWPGLEKETNLDYINASILAMTLSSESALGGVLGRGGGAAGAAEERQRIEGAAKASRAALAEVGLTRLTEAKGQAIDPKTGKVQMRKPWYAAIVPWDTGPPVPQDKIVSGEDIPAFTASEIIALTMPMLGQGPYDEEAMAQRVGVVLQQKLGLANVDVSKLKFEVPAPTAKEPDKVDKLEWGEFTRKLATASAYWREAQSLAFGLGDTLKAQDTPLGVNAPPEAYRPGPTQTAPVSSLAQYADDPAAALAQSHAAVGQNAQTLMSASEQELQRLYAAINGQSAPTAPAAPAPAASDAMRAMQEIQRRATQRLAR